MRGTIDSAPKVTETGTDRLVISDCYDDHTGIYRLADGSRIDKDDPRRHLVTVTIVQGRPGLERAVGISPDRDPRASPGGPRRATCGSLSTNRRLDDDGRCWRALLPGYRRGDQCRLAIDE